MYVGNVIYGGVITLVGTTVMQLPLENAAASGATLNYEFLFSDPD